MKKDTPLAIVLFFCCFLLIGLHAEDKAPEPAIKVVMTDSGANLADYGALRGFGAITFFLYTPGAPSEEAQKVEKAAIENLKKFGEVATKSSSPEQPQAVNQKNNLRNPFLSYEIKNVRDIEGKVLPLLKATLIFEAPTRVEKNKEYCYSTLWSRSCYIKSSDLETAASQTFASLLKDFEKDYLEANQGSSLKPIFHFAGL